MFWNKIYILKGFRPVGSLQNFPGDPWSILESYQADLASWDTSSFSRIVCPCVLRVWWRTLPSLVSLSFTKFLSLRCIWPSFTLWRVVITKWNGGINSIGGGGESPQKLKCARAVGYLYSFKNTLVIQSIRFSFPVVFKLLCSCYTSISCRTE